MSAPTDAIVDDAGLMDLPPSVAPHVTISNTVDHASQLAALQTAHIMRECLAHQPFCTLVLATGVSQFKILSTLVHVPGIDWGRVICFHLDEYIGIPGTHPASFRRFLHDRFVAPLAAAQHVSVHTFHGIEGDTTDPEAECTRLGALIAQHTPDVALVGIGENGHLAFNDPPADFATDKSYLVVNLDNRCRMQQVGEGWFPNLDAVPSKAISMSIPQIMKAKHIICTVTDLRKAEAVHKTLDVNQFPDVTPMVPASILRKHPACYFFTDFAAVSQWKPY